MYRATLNWMVAVMFMSVLTVGSMATANPIPIPLPASMPLEEMWIDIDRAGGTLHASFRGDFTFDYIPETVTTMWFPVPVGSTSIKVGHDGAPLSWTWSTELYPTVLPEAPLLPMIEWAGPFPTSGAVFNVEYEHDLIKRPEKYVFFYALGTGKYFPTYDKITNAEFDISLPPGLTPSSIWLDTTQLDPSHYTSSDPHLEISLTSHFGPFTKDLIILLVPEPSTFILLGIGGVGILALVRRRGGQ